MTSGAPYRLHVLEGSRDHEAVQIMCHLSQTPLKIIEHSPGAGFEKAVPYQELPALEVDLQYYTQLPAIHRFFATVTHLSPDNPFEMLEADMVVSAVERFRKCPKAMVPTLNDPETVLKGQPPQEVSDLTRGMRGLGRGGRRGRGGRGRGRRGDQELGSGSGPMRRAKRRHEINPLAGVRKNPFELGESGTCSTPRVPMRPGSDQLMARDYLLAFTRQLETNLEGANYLVGSQMTYGDIVLVAELKKHLTAHSQFLKNFPVLREWYDNRDKELQGRGYGANGV